MSELDDIRMRKLASMQAQDLNKQQNAANEEANLRKQIAELESIVKQVLTKEALERYSNIKAVDYDKAVQIIAVIGQLVQSGRVEMIDDKMLIQLLSKLAPKKRQINIKRV